MNTTYVATAGLETAPLQDGSVLYNLKTGKFIMLNRSAAFLWTELSTAATADELSRRLCGAFPDVTSTGAPQDVSVALARLEELELVSSRDNAAGAHVSSSTPRSEVEASTATLVAYESPSIRVLDEDELLNIFQMTAAEISVASCWWNNCVTSGCP